MPVTDFQILFCQTEDTGNVPGSRGKWHSHMRGRAGKGVDDDERLPVRRTADGLPAPRVAPTLADIA